MALLKEYNPRGFGPWDARSGARKSDGLKTMLGEFLQTLLVELGLYRLHVDSSEWPSLDLQFATFSYSL